MHTHYQVSTQHLPVLGTSGDLVGRCVLQRRDFFSLVLTLASSQHKPTIFIVANLSESGLGVE